jgi:hypothetical protein
LKKCDTLRLNYNERAALAFPGHLASQQAALTYRQAQVAKQVQNSKARLRDVAVQRARADGLRQLRRELVRIVLGIAEDDRAPCTHVRLVCAPDHE